MPERSSSRLTLSGRSRRLATVAGAALILAACSSTSSKVASAGAPVSSTPESSTTAAAAGVVKTASTSLGTVVVDSATGRTLYHFDHDTTPGTSSCTGGCATAWPPMTVASMPSGNVGGGALGHIARADGTTQVTWNGMPLYRFAGDAAAGDVKGDGVGGFWHATRATSGAAAPGGGTTPSGTGAAITSTQSGPGY